MKRSGKPSPLQAPTPGVRRVRADAQRNLEVLLQAAKEVFAASGVDAPVRTIASLAGVGVGTVYRHFPQRSDLVAAVFRREVDACAASATALRKQHTPVEALAKWLERYTQFIATKRGLAAALHSGDPAFATLPEYFRQHLEPTLHALLEAAVAAGEVGTGVGAYDLLRAVSNLSVPDRDGATGHTQRMVALLVDGLRSRASGPIAAEPPAGTKPKRR